MKILIDAMGGDNAPVSTVKGCALALKKRDDLNLIVVGPIDQIKPMLEKEGADLSRVELIDAQEVVLNSDHPASFLKQKPNSSLAVCFETLRKRDDVDGLLSAGPTGAVLTGAVLRIGRLENVNRPCLIATLPTQAGTMVRVLDCGANMDSKPEYLLQFALMGNAYLKLLGIETPRIGLLNVGSEDGKGNELTKAASALLKEADLNFIGNIEGDHVLTGEADAVICDGFAGNVFLKSTEEACMFVASLFKKAIAGNFFRKIGALFQLKGLKEAKKPFEAAKKGCAPLLGTKKLVVKTHGKSNEETFMFSILETASYADHRLIEKISEAIQTKA